MYFTLNFWMLTLERAIKAAAYGAMTAFTVNELGATSLDWSRASVLALSALTGFVLSVLGSVASAPVGEHASPSLVTPKPPE